MGEVRKLTFDDRSIIEIDYSDLKEPAMIELLGDLNNLLVDENSPLLVLSIFNEKNYITPNFMRNVEKITGEHIDSVKKMAIVGLTRTQTTILQAYNLKFNRNFKSFSERPEAIRYLLDEKSSEGISGNPFTA